MKDNRYCHSWKGHFPHAIGKEDQARIGPEGTKAYIRKGLEQFT